MTLILSIGEGRLSLISLSERGGCDLILSLILPISHPTPPGNYCTVPKDEVVDLYGLNTVILESPAERCTFSRSQNNCGKV